MSAQQDKLSSIITTGFETRVVEITDYSGNKDYDNHIFVECDNEGLVLRESDLSLVGFAKSAYSNCSPCKGNDVMHAEVLEVEYGFLEVAKSFVRGKRGTYRTTGEHVVNLYEILQTHIPKYCEFVTLSRSDASSEEILSRSHSLVGSIICSLDEKTLQLLSSKKNGTSFAKFLLVALQRNTSLFFERNPVTC